MSLQVAISYGEQIRQRHEAGQRADSDLRQAMLRKIEITRETGQLIADAKGDLRHDEFTQATSFLDQRAIKSYLKFARSNPEPISDLERAIISIRAALQPSGALEFPDGHGPQNLHEPNFFSHAIGLIQRLLGIYRHYLRRCPLKCWRSEQLQSLIASLRPVADVYRDLNRELESR
jgi:hypothetical protein